MPCGDRTEGTSHEARSGASDPDEVIVELPLRAPSTDHSRRDVSSVADNCCRGRSLPRRGRHRAKDNGVAKDTGEVPTSMCVRRR